MSGVRVGDRVVVNPGLNCDECEYCLQGQDSLCVDYKILGEHVNGGYAEYVKIPAKNALPFPEAFSFEEAAAVPLVFMTAWRMLVTRARLRPGEDVLILGAGGGVSSAAIQIAHLAGARVIATSSDKEKLKRARELGADLVIDHSEVDLEKEVWKLTNKRGVDVVFDNVGAATWKKSLRSLAKGGRLVTCGATTGAMGETDIRLVFWRQIDILGSTMGTRKELNDVLQLVWKGKLKPVVDRVLPLSQAREAQQILMAGKQFGKIVLRP